MMVAACPLGEQTRWSPNASARNQTVTLAALHESVGGTEAMSVALFCERAGVSYHAIADNNTLVYCVPRSKKAWHLRNGNPRADGLCLTTPVAGYTREQWLGPQLNKVKVAGWWLALVCADRGLDLEACSLQDVRNALAGSRSAGGATTHNDYTLATRDGTHTDPRNFPFDVALDYARQYAGGTAPVIPAPTPQKKALSTMIDRRFDKFTGVQTGRIVCPVGSASVVVGRAWFNCSFDGGVRVEAWFQKSAPGSDGAAPGTGPAIDWTLKNAERGVVEIPGGTEFVQYRLSNPEGAGAICIEMAPK